jgi:hypothetical protein
MNNAALLAEGLELARQFGFQIREEDLDGAGGGHCSFAGKKWLLLDVAQSPQEQLADVADALRNEPNIVRCTMSHALAAKLQTKMAA